MSCRHRRHRRLPDHIHAARVDGAEDGSVGREELQVQRRDHLRAGGRSSGVGAGVHAKGAGRRRAHGADRHLHHRARRCESSASLSSAPSVCGAPRSSASSTRAPPRRISGAPAQLQKPHTRINLHVKRPEPGCETVGTALPRPLWHLATSPKHDGTQTLRVGLCVEQRSFLPWACTVACTWHSFTSRTSHRIALEQADGTALPDPRLRHDLYCGATIDDYKVSICAVRIPGRGPTHLIVSRLYEGSRAATHPQPGARWDTISTDRSVTGRA